MAASLCTIAAPPADDGAASSSAAGLREEQGPQDGARGENRPAACGSAEELTAALSEAESVPGIAALWRENPFEPEHVELALRRVAAMTWDMGARSVEAGELTDALARHLEANLQAFTLAQRAEAVFWLAGMNYAADEALEQLRQALVRRCDELDVPRAAMAMWALSRTTGVHYKVQRAVDRHVEAHVNLGGDVDPQSAARLLWAHATTGHWQSTSFHVLERAVVSAAAAGRFSLGDLVNVAHAYSVARKDRARDVLDAAAGHLAPRVSEMRPGALAKALHAFAKARHSAPQLFAAAAAHATAALDVMPYPDLSIITWASARLYPGGGPSSNPDDPAEAEAEANAASLLRAVKGLVAANPQRFAAADLAKLLWSFAAAGLADAELVQQCARALGNPRQLPSHDLTRLLQVEMLLRPSLPVSPGGGCSTNSPGDGVANASSAQQPCPETNSQGAHSGAAVPAPTGLLPPELLAAAEAAFKAACSQAQADNAAVESACAEADRENPKRQAMLCAALDRMEVPYRSKVPLANELLEIDLALDLPGGKTVLLEVDGPYYFAAHPTGLSGTHRELGRLALRRRIIEAWAPGQPVVRVPFFEWDATALGKGRDVCGVLASQASYLRSKLSNVTSTDRGAS